MRIKPCWSCLNVGPCLTPCACAKCVNPVAYAAWRRERPDQHRRWLARQALDPDDADRLMAEAEALEDEVLAGYGPGEPRGAMPSGSNEWLAWELRWGLAGRRGTLESAREVLHRVYDILDATVAQRATR